MSVKERWHGTRPLTYGIEEILNMVMPVFKSDKRILTTYLFGSRLGAQESTSDIDLAFYTSGDFTYEDYFMLYRELTRPLHSDRLDLVWLNVVEPALGLEVIKNGRVYYYKDPDILSESELKIKKRYYYLRKHRTLGMVYRKESLLRRIEKLRQYRVDLAEFGNIKSVDDKEFESMIQLCDFTQLM